MKRADDGKHVDAWKKMLATRGKRDLYVIQQEAGLTFVQGTVHEGSADGRTVAFEKETGGKPDGLLQSRLGRARVLPAAARRAYRRPCAASPTCTGTSSTRPRSPLRRRG